MSSSGRMVSTAIRRSGIGTSSTRRNASVASTTPRIWRHRESSCGSCPGLAQRPSVSCARPTTWPSNQTIARPLSRAQTHFAAQNGSGAQPSRQHLTDRLTRTWCEGALAKQSSPGIPGSRTGAATHSSPSAACAWRRADCARRATSCSNGRTRCRRVCCRTASPITVKSQSSTRLMRPCWYVIAVHEFLEHASTAPNLVSAGHEQALRRAVEAIVSGYAAGTRFGIQLDADGLLRAGMPGLQLTWMDARVGDRVITPRIGKPVEIQALWLNAVAAAGLSEPRWRELFERGRASFIDRFWSDARGYLADVVDIDHIPGTRDDSFRPNQILAIGGLPIALIEGERARRVVDEVERRLLTPLGLRSLAPGEPGYSARYEGGPSTRDGIYHQGTVWPWLIGPFVQAWLRTRGNTSAARREARLRFLQPLLEHVETAGLGHVSEIADAEAPFTPRGCPFQAWSLGELIRLDRQILAPPPRRASRRREIQVA